MSEQEAASSSSEIPMEIPEAQEKKEEFTEPDAKKRKISKLNDDKKYKLEERLGGILCCAVCLDLPRAAVYQVSDQTNQKIRVLKWNFRFFLLRNLAFNRCRFSLFCYAAPEHCEQDVVLIFSCS